MNSAAIPIFLGLVVAVISGPACPQNCIPAIKYHKQHFMLDSELSHSSVAPWDLRNNTEAGREPENILEAVCRTCNVEKMKARPIYLQILVYQRISNNADTFWCRCPFKLAVGCTCVATQ